MSEPEDDELPPVSASMRQYVDAFAAVEQPAPGKKVGTWRSIEAELEPPARRGRWVVSGAVLAVAAAVALLVLGPGRSLVSSAEGDAGVQAQREGAASQSGGAASEHRRGGIADSDADDSSPSDGANALLDGGAGGNGAGDGGDPDNRNEGAEADGLDPATLDATPGAMGAPANATNGGAGGMGAGGGAEGRGAAGGGGAVSRGRAAGGNGVANGGAAGGGAAGGGGADGGRLDGRLDGGAQGWRSGGEQGAGDVDAPGLAGELALIKRANAALKGNPKTVLEVLDEYDRTFPKGTLRPEATVLRAQALCAQGHRDQANAIRERFLATHPKSTLGDRMRCD